MTDLSSCEGACAPVPAPDWIAVDWGTSALRAWAMGRDGRIHARAASGAGMGSLSRAEFEPALIALIGPWLETAAAPVPVIACGMVGARQGWQEAPYRSVPCAPLAGALARIAPQDPRFTMAVVPGLCQARPADVMRGEETQIAGFLVAEPEFDGTLCLPGTHTKWVHVSAGEIVSFQTCMTGETFALLSRHSVLRHSMPGEDWDGAAFADAVTDAMTAPQRFSARLFALRAETLLAGLVPGAARARLSGLLIGMELAATKPYWLGRDVVIVGAPGLAPLYAAALAGAGVAARTAASDGITLAGLARAWQGERR